MSGETDNTIVFEDRVIGKVNSQKFLGVCFQEDLAWNVHIDTVTELSKTVGCLYRLSSLVPPCWKLHYTMPYSTPD